VIFCSVENGEFDRIMHPSARGSKHSWKEWADGAGVNSIMVSANGRWLATGFGVTACRWDLSAPHNTPLVYQNEQTITGVAISGSGRLAIASKRGTFVLDGNPHQHLQDFPDLNRVDKMALSRDGRWLAVSLGCGVSLHDVDSGKCLVSYSRYEGDVVAISFDSRGQGIVAHQTREGFAQG
jgi:WD40 repeat protein